IMATSHLVAALWDLYARIFTESRRFVRIKCLAFVAYIGFIGFGFRIQIDKLAAQAAAAQAANKVIADKVEIEFTAPEPSLAICGLLAVGFVIFADLYVSRRRNEHALRLYQLASDPATPPDVKEAILRRT